MLEPLKVSLLILQVSLTPLLLNYLLALTLDLLPIVPSLVILAKPLLLHPLLLLAVDLLTTLVPLIISSSVLRPGVPIRLRPYRTILIPPSIAVISLLNAALLLPGLPLLLDTLIRQDLPVYRVVRIQVALLLRLAILILDPPLF